MVRTTGYSRKGRPKFYTDPQGRVRIIPSRGSRDHTSGFNVRKFRQNYHMVLKSQTPKVVGLVVFKTVFATLAVSSPFIGQVYASYRLANGLYNAYKSAGAVTNAYATQGAVEAAKVLGIEILSGQLAETQAQVGWNLIASRIDPEVQPAAKLLLTECVEKLTVEEIDFVERHLA